MVIGRRHGDIIIPDPLISSKHAKIFKLDDGWYIEDLHSTNGLSVGGKLTQRTKLTPGVEIVVGNSTMVLFVGSPKKVEPKAIQPQHTAPKIELAWLLDEELESDNNADGLDTIANDLRVPPNFLADIEVVNGLDVGKVFPVNAGTMVIGRQYGGDSLVGSRDFTTTRPVGNLFKRHDLRQRFGVNKRDLSQRSQY